MSNIGKDMKCSIVMSKYIYKYYWESLPASFFCPSLFSLSLYLFINSTLFLKLSEENRAFLINSSIYFISLSQHSCVKIEDIYKYPKVEMSPIRSQKQISK